MPHIYFGEKPGREFGVLFLFKFHTGGISNKKKRAVSKKDTTLSVFT